MVVVLKVDDRKIGRLSVFKTDSVLDDRMSVWLIIMATQLIALSFILLRIHLMHLIGQDFIFIAYDEGALLNGASRGRLIINLKGVI